MYSLTDDDFTPNIIGHVGEMKAKSFYTPSFTEYGAYFYCGGENSARKVYFISAGIRLADVYEVQPGYTAHLSGTMTSIFGDGMNTVMSFTMIFFIVPSEEWMVYRNCVLPLHKSAASVTNKHI